MDDGKLHLQQQQNMVEPGISSYSTLSKHTGKKNTRAVFSVYDPSLRLIAMVKIMVEFT